MKIKEGFMLRQVAGNYIVVPVGAASVDFNGMLTLNETGAFLFKALQQGAQKDELADALLKEYDVDRSTAETHIDKFIEKLKGADLFE